ncbi:MAG: hypothetical protein VKK59_00730 [Vampirovibrionales bacterium]|nr:hypothetical protein [Vampirovibrionales bacterium]
MSLFSISRFPLTARYADTRIKRQYGSVSINQLSNMRSHTRSQAISNPPRATYTPTYTLSINGSLCPGGFREVSNQVRRSSATQFDAVYYLGTNRDVARAYGENNLEGAKEHFLTYGKKEGRNPNANFDTQYYLKNNPDVAAAITESKKNSQRIREEAKGFDAAYYFKNNPDVATLGWAPSHFIMFGKNEGRSPNAKFDSEYYLKNNPDVAAAVEKSSNSSRLIREKAKDFDAAYYLKTNPDVAKAYGENNLEGAKEHFLTYGKKEGRNPNANFDTEYYLKYNFDVAGAVKAGQITAFDHYVGRGFMEGRLPNAASDPLTAYEHYVSNGFDEGRLPNAESKPLTAFDHYLNYGFKEGRFPFEP